MSRSRRNPTGWGLVPGFRAAWGGVVLALMAAALPPCRGAERPPFDLSYVPADATGVIAVRPNVIFSDPAMRPLAKMANDALAQLLPIDRSSTAPALRLEEIEQIVVYMKITPHKEGPLGQHTFTATPVIIRTAHDFDWRKLMRQVDPNTEEVRPGDHLCYKSSLKVFGNAEGMPFYHAIPDKRTLVAALPAEMVLGKQAGVSRTSRFGVRPHFAWDKDWKCVERGLFAVAMDNGWTRGLSPERIGGEPWANALAQHAATMVAGVDWVGGIDFHAYLSCKDRAAAEQAMGDVKTLLGQLRRDLEQPPPAVPAAEQPPIVAQLHFWKALFEQARVTRQDSTACVHTAVKMRVADVAKGIRAMFPMPPK